MKKNTDTIKNNKIGGNVMKKNSTSRFTQGTIETGTWNYGGKRFNPAPTEKQWIMTEQVYDQIRMTLGTRKPEQGGILGSSDGIHIDHYYYDRGATRTSSTYTMNEKDLNRVIAEWNDNDIEFVGVIHSHPYGCTMPSFGDMEQAKIIIESMDVRGKLFTPIVQVSPKLNGDIKLYPYTFEQTVEMKEQPLSIEKTAPNELDAKKRKELDKKAPRRFKKIESVFPGNLMAKKKIICIGCGGSRPFLETLARCGVREFVLFDGDVVEDTNIATQGTYISEIGKPKTEVIKDRILDINPLANVVCVNNYLSNDITDAEFVYITSLFKSEKRDTLICGCTDNFYAQDRCAQLAVKYGIPYLAAQVFEKGIGHEVIFYYPGVTQSCPRCMLESRYKAILTSKGEGTGESEGAAVFVTDYLNAIKTYVAVSILCYDETSTRFYRNLDKLADRNYLMTRCSESLDAPAFEPLDQLAAKESDLSFPYVTIAIGQTPEPDCPLCGGETFKDTNEKLIEDTRYLPNKYSA